MLDGNLFHSPGLCGTTTLHVSIIPIRIPLGKHGRVVDSAYAPVSLRYRTSFCSAQLGMWPTHAASARYWLVFCIHDCVWMQVLSRCGRV